MRVQIFPSEEVISLAKGSRYTFAAVGFDGQNEALGGLGVSWTVRRDAENSVERSIPSGMFHANRVGTFKLKATIHGISDERTVTVVDPDLGDNGSAADSPKKPQFPVKVSSRDGKKKSDGQQFRLSSNLLPGDGWTDDNWESADVPGNLPGNPTGSPLDGGAGNGNFQITAPVVSLPGRGIDVALNLVYNSRLWNKSGSEMTYDIGYDEPAPGWSLGFGKLEHMGEGGCMMVDADGTRHGYTGSLTSVPSYMEFKGHTTDGKFIDYACRFNYVTGGGHGWAKLPNGTTVIYNSISTAEAHLQPTQITDIQGNYISITYRNVSGNAIIETVTDTMGRVIFFDYDTNDRLIQVRVPGMNDGVSARYRTAIKLHYKQITLSHAFASGTTTRIRNSSPYVIDSIYYPGTNTGYWFGDADSYSSYGMIAKVIEQRGMSWSGVNGTQGTVSQGSMTKLAEYNYPLSTANVSGRTNGSGLTDAPTYTKLEESWAAADVSSASVTTYAFNDNTWHNDGTGSKPARSVVVTQPNGTISKQFTHRTPNVWTDGLVFSDETAVMDGSSEVLISRSNVSWQQGSYDSPRPAWAQVFDEDGSKVKTVYDYTGGLFNQITKSCDYDNADNKLKCATAEYENSTAYTGTFNGSGEYTGGQHLFNLVKKSVVEDAAGTVISRTDYEYDNYSSNALVDTPGVIQHEQRYNPFTTTTQDGPYCILWVPDDAGCTYEGQEVNSPTMGYSICSCNEYEQVTVYDNATDKRGNITKTTVYSGAAGATGAIEEKRQYDITGNAVKINSSCCEQISIQFDDVNTTAIDTQYAYPVSQTHGSSSSSSPLKVSTSSVYDFSTGLVFSTTDTNGRTSMAEYDSDTLRPIKTTTSTGAYSTTSYDDANMKVTEEVHDSGGISAGKSIKYLNGIGQVKKEESFAPAGVVDIVEIKYDQYGREWKTSRPFRSGDTIYWTEKFYDAQDRLIKVVEPDGSETKAFYNETTLPDSVSAKPGKPYSRDGLMGSGKMGPLRSAGTTYRCGRTES